MTNIAIVNRTNLKNYGSVLQVYALCAAVRKLGYEPEVVWQKGNMSRNFDIRPNKAIMTASRLIAHPSLLWSTIKTIREVKSHAIDGRKVKKFDDFVAANFKQSFYDQGELSKIAKSDRYAKFVCGSDQIWCTTTLYPDPMMYLRFAPEEKRVAYAPSLGRNYIPDYNKKTLRKFINGVPCLSVREDEGARLVKELTGRDATVVADPTLLLNMADWDRLKADIETPEKYVLCYFLDEPSDEVKEAICRHANESGNDIVTLGVLGNLDYPQEKVHSPIAGPGEFITLTSKADMVITDSYHGMLFAINYHKKFWSVKRAYSQFDQSSRQLTVLSRLGLTERYVTAHPDFTDIGVDYAATQVKINEFTASSINYLKKSLEK